MSSDKYKTVDGYISTFPGNIQKILKKLKTIIKNIAPDTTEGISYGIPTFYLDGKYLVYFAGFKNHVSIYPATTKAVEKSGLAGYKISKGTLKFPLDKPMPYDLIKKFVEIRVKEQVKSQN